MSTPTITFTPLPYGAVSQLDKETLRVNENYPEGDWYSRENVLCDTLRGLVEFTEGDCSVRYHSHRRQIEVALLRDGELTVPSVEGYKALSWSPNRSRMSSTFSGRYKTHSGRRWR